MIGHGQSRKLAADADAGVGNDQIDRAQLGMCQIDGALDVAIASDIGFMSPPVPKCGRAPQIEETGAEGAAGEVRGEE